MRDGDRATFNGDLAATKYSAVSLVNRDNVQRLEKAWELRTGDVSDGKGQRPKTVWSAMPLFVNDTRYLGTRFYRILVLDPANGRVKWSHDTHARLEALTQAALKCRGVAYWESDATLVRAGRLPRFGHERRGRISTAGVVPRPCRW